VKKIGWFSREETASFKRSAFGRFRENRAIFSFGDAAGGLSLIRFFRPCERNECPRGERIPHKRSPQQTKIHKNQTHQNTPKQTKTDQNKPNRPNTQTKQNQTNPKNINFSSKSLRKRFLSTIFAPKY
jgi:hypothetical protein